VQREGAITSARYSCSTLPFDVTSTYPLVYTEWASTATSIRYVYCRTTPTVVGGAAVATGMVESDEHSVKEDVEREMEKRQTATETESSTSYSFHRTWYVPSPTTVTAAAVTTRVVYQCYTPTPRVTATPTPTPTPSAGGGAGGM
jgi:hypothetical protein